MADFFKRLCCCFFPQSDYELIPGPSSTSLDPVSYLQQSSYHPKYTRTLHRPAYLEYDSTYLRSQGVIPRGTWEFDPRKVTAFKAWKAQSINLSSTTPADLQQLTGLTYYENQELTTEGIPPVSIYLAPEVTAPWDKSGILVLNFNMTITKHHTYTPNDEHNSKYRGYNISAEARCNNIRHLRQLCDVLSRAKENRVAIAIVTRDNDMAHVLAYLQALVTQIHPDANISDYISIVLCSFTFMTDISRESASSSSQKAGEVSFIAELLLRNYRSTPKVPMMFIDHAINSTIFTLQMRDKDTRTKQSDKIMLQFNRATQARGEDDNNRHLIEAQIFIANCSTPAAVASRSYSSSK